MGGGGGPIQDDATRREMGGPVSQQGGQSVEASGGSAALSCKVEAGEVRTGGTGTAWAAWADCSSRPEGIVTFFYLFK
jgi:hypothetical protein